MATVRFYLNEKRISTARMINSGYWLQVYPEKKAFISEEDWRTYWNNSIKNGIRVQRTEAPVPAANTIVRQPQPQKLRLTKYSPETSFSAPAGDYYIGDLCYALPSDVYDKIFGGTVYSPGLYQLSNGGFFLVAHTSCGDGAYKGTNGREYLVDAGIIGIASLNVCRPVADWDAGEVHSFKYPVRCEFKDGLFSFNEPSNGFEIET
jgi:hypothetical protein